MAEKDILEKILLSYADVFADCENSLVYKGKRVLKPEELLPAPTESFYHGPGQYSDTKENCVQVQNQFCDVSFYRVDKGNIRAQYMIGNETRLKKRQVLRKASYQGGAYRGQLESGKPTYPVMGIVLDWTYKSSRIPVSLRELLIRDGAASEELEQIDEVRLKVFHMKNLSEEVRRRFTSDMGFVVDFLNEGHFDKRKNQKIVHMEALCEMMKAITNDIRFTDAVKGLMKKQEEGREIIMCEYIDMLEARGEERGRAIGEEIGEERGRCIGENRLAKLIQVLLEEQKLGDVALVSSDSGKRHELYEAYGI